ncbi:MAG: alkane 1-monooxygenase [Saprospirales bacterium]|nr:MAG: alkane 1-monooxygenase [Saprospirales bacterium]
MKWFKYLIAYLGPISLGLGLYLQGGWVWSPFVLLFIILPLIEWTLPVFDANLRPPLSTKLEAEKIYDWVLYGNLPLLWGLVFWYAYTISSTSLHAAEYAGLTVGMGIVLGSFGINVAHELGHRLNNWDQWMARLLLLPALFMRFTIEHNYGHHKYVATELDPASAEKGLAVYPFIIRSFIGTWRGAYAIENRRLRRAYDKGKPLQNRVILFEIAQLAYLLIMGWLFGWLAVPFLIISALIGIALLEIVNYIEHYGLRRKKLKEGRYEAVGPAHSWNSSHLMSRLFLYELSRHPDHHQKAEKKYQVLNHIKESPQMPFGYPMMIILSMIPPIWFKMMDSRLPDSTGQ